MKRALFTVLMVYICATSTMLQAQPIIDQIARSHVDANVPLSSDFHAFMLRDLEAYFKGARGGIVKVKYELLRNGPTQTGVASPKYYLWIEVFEDNILLLEGAVKVAAIEQKNFDVTNFLERAQIEQNPEILYSVFPRAVGDKIKEMLAKK